MQSFGMFHQKKARRTTHNWMALLQHLVDEDQRLECLHLITEDRLHAQPVPDGRG